MEFMLHVAIIPSTNGDRKEVLVGENPEAFTHIVKIEDAVSNKGYYCESSKNFICILPF